ncbi:hypothetical protein NEF87_004068 [Candidatus Lokiarchaeum ossiferum]|uniref:Uncharacterized protein n=1 Tax=Candidatus Lokiarchaeum ossiferum TaxID=2951803 RepID=A0ABY6HW78_9ARCH|nr:hypothetical protein NEF87_004068 [Candidatus Lokiarchaeum sp. B-35]
MLEDYLDIQTLSFITSIVSISTFIVMLFVAKKQKIYPGFKEWTLANFFNSLGMILLALRPILPDFISIIIANNFILLYLVFIARGLRKFAEGDQQLWFDVIPPLLLTIFFIFYTYVIPNVNARIIIISSLIFLISCRICYIIWTGIYKILLKKQIFLFTSFVIFIGWHLTRLILTILLESQIEDFLEAGIIQGLAFINIISSNIIQSLLLIDCNSQKLEKDLNESQDEIKNLSGLLPICSSCKKIRNESNSWDNIENYISDHSDALLTHSLCPECVAKLYPDMDFDELED